MIILGPFESFSILQKTGSLPKQASSQERLNVLGHEQLIALPQVVFDQERVFCTPPKLDGLAIEVLKKLGIMHQRDKVTSVVNSPNHRRRTKNMSCVVLEKNLPAKSLLRITGDVYILCPALCLIMLAKCRAVSDEELVFGGYELCSRYAYPRYGERNLICITPLTRTEHIAAYLDEISRLNNQAPDGLNRLQRLLPYMLDGARSPYEIASSMFMSWSTDHGGLGIPHFEMNRRIDLSSQERAELGKSYLEADFFWPMQRVILEYDGGVHSGRREPDSLRANILRDKGNSVEVLTKSIIKNPDSYIKFMKRFEEPLGFDIEMGANARNRRQAFQKRVIDLAEHRGVLSV